MVGLGDGDPGELFGDHSDAGLLGLLAPGTPTNTVDGAPAASLGSEREWWERVQSPPTHVNRDVSLALTGRADELQFVGPLEEYHEPWASHLITALWPALFGFAAEDVWALPDAQSAQWWAAYALFPEGPYPTLRLGSQPYGLLPATSLEDWRAVDGDSPLEAALAHARDAVLGSWVTAAEARGTAAGATIEGLLGRLADTPTAIAYRHRPAIALELWWLILAVSGSAIPWAEFEKAWNTEFPVAGELNLHPQRRYGAIGTPVLVGLPLVRPEKLSPEQFVDVLKQLIQIAFESPSAFRSIPGLEKRYFQHGELDSLLLRLAVRALQVAIGDIGRTFVNEGPPLLDPVARQQSTEEHLARWIELVIPSAVQEDTAEAKAFRLVADGIVNLIGIPEDRLERLLRATLDTASHRVDPWFTGIATRRLQDALDSGGARMRLGAYGWVDAPRPGTPGPTAAGFIHAPSQAQALTASVLRDRSINDADPARWHMDMTSRTVKGDEPDRG